MLTHVKSRTLHRCTSCDATSPQWFGRCSRCGEWGSLVAVPTPGNPKGASEHAGNDADGDTVPLGEIDPADALPHPSGIDELDRVLGGGFVPGSVTLFAGEPGTGKSTLCLQAAHTLAASGHRCLVVCAEESPAQVRRRAERLDLVHASVLHDDVLVTSAASLDGIRAAVHRTEPAVVVVDSIQTVADPGVAGSPGSVTQVRECAHALATLAREQSIVLVLIGHVTKGGAVAGPKVLEHLVDTVLAFEGDRTTALRMLRAHKHRFGPTGEVGVFELGERGLVDVADPSQRFLAGSRALPGSAIAPVLDGARPMLVEVQALVAPTAAASPRRVATGLDGRRVDQLVAVLERRAGVALGGADIYVAVAGGARVADGGVDLAVVAAIAGARTDQPMRHRTVALGEVGLGGELRPLQRPMQRLSEAARMGFTTAVVPDDTPEHPGIDAVRCATLVQALPALLEHEPVTVAAR